MTANPTVKQMLELKFQLQEDIKSLIECFETQSGLGVDNIYLNSSSMYYPSLNENGFDLIRSVNVEVQLDV